MKTFTEFIDEASYIVEGGHVFDGGSDNHILSD